jgi:hypothetical protein
MYATRKTAPVSLPRPPKYTLFTDLLLRSIYCESALLAALLARLVVILRHRSNLDPHAVASLVSRPM